MPEQEPTSDSAEEPDYIQLDQLTLSLEGPLLDLLLTESGLQHDPVISIAPHTRENSVALHMPFRVNGIESVYDVLFSSENYVHTQLNLDRAKELHEELGAAIESLEDSD